MKKIKFKKFLVLFSLLICVFCMTACSSSNGTISTASAKTELKQQQLDASEAYLVDWVKDMITYLDKNDSAKITADAEAAQSLTMVNNKLYIVDQSGISVKTIAFYNSWNSTRDELGALKSINEINVELNSKTGELCTITVDTSYEKNDKCTFEFVINDDYTLENGAINPSYTTGQKMHKAIAIIQFKLEGQLLRRHKEFHMEDRCLLHRINPEKGTVTLADGKEYPMLDTEFPTIDWKHPYELTPGELDVMERLETAFRNCEKLQNHMPVSYTHLTLPTT